MSASSAWKTFTRRRCCKMHEWPVWLSCAAALAAMMDVRSGPLVSPTEAKIEQMLRRNGWRLRARLLGCWVSGYSFRAG